MHEALGFITTVYKVNFVISMYFTKMFKEEEEGNTMSYAPPAHQKGKCHAHGLSSGPMKNSLETDSSPSGPLPDLNTHVNTHPECKHHIKKNHGGCFPLWRWVCFGDL